MRRNGICHINLYADFSAFADHATVLIVDEFSFTLLSSQLLYPDESELLEVVRLLKELATSVLSKAHFIWDLRSFKDAFSAAEEKSFPYDPTDPSV